MFFIDLIRKICCCFGSTSSSPEHEPILGEGPYYLDSTNGGPIQPPGETGYSSPIVPPTTDSYTFSVNTFSASQSNQRRPSILDEENEVHTPVGSLSLSESDNDFGLGETRAAKHQGSSNSAPSSPNGSTASGFSSLGFNTPEKNGSQPGSSYHGSPLSFRSDFSLGSSHEVHSLNFSDDEQQNHSDGECPGLTPQL